MPQEPVDEFFDDDDFAVAATYTQGATSVGILVLFDASSASLSAEGIVLASAQPKILVKTSDTGNITEAGTFVIGGVTYKVLSIGPDEHGVREVMLRQ